MTTKQDIKDYLHLYLGCEVVHDKGVYKGTLIGMDVSCAKIHCDFFNKTHCVPKDKDFGDFDIMKNRIKPILRPLSDLGDYEKLDRDQFATSKAKPYHYSFAMETLWYLKNGFDIFKLIESGLAIDATTIKNKTTPT